MAAKYRRDQDQALALDAMIDGAAQPDDRMTANVHQAVQPEKGGYAEATVPPEKPPGAEGAEEIAPGVVIEPGASIAGMPGETLTAIPVLKCVECLVTVSMLAPGQPISGYLGRAYSVNFEVPRHLVGRFRRFTAGLHESGATYAGAGGKTLHVDSATDAFKWFLAQLPE